MKFFHRCILLGILQFQFRFSRSFIYPLSTVSLDSKTQKLPPRNTSNVLFCSKEKRKVSVSLMYRNHDEEDDDSTMFKLKSRASPTFKKSDVGPSGKYKRGSINKSLVDSLVLNQLFILSVSISIVAIYLFVTVDLQFLSDGVNNWTGYVKYSNEGLMPLLVSLLEGLIGSIPMILFGTRLESSEDRRLAKANFSTIFMVMTLFGRRSQVLPSSEETQKTTPKRTKLDRLEPLTDWRGEELQIFLKTSSTSIF